jgi:hypothetical protein
MRQEVMETLICLLRASQAREHSHGPNPSSIHGRLNPPRERIDARETNVAGIVDVFYIFWSVQAFDLKIGDRAESREAFRGFSEDLRQALCPPFLFLFDLFEFVLSEHELPPPSIADCGLQIEDGLNLKF